MTKGNLNENDRRFFRAGDFTRAIGNMGSPGTKEKQNKVLAKRGKMLSR